MRIARRESGPVTILEMAGSVTRDHGVGEVKAAVEPLLQQGRNQILLDMAGVSYMDSNGIGELVSVFISVRNRQGRLKIVHLGDRMRELFEIAKLVEVFEPFDDEAAALRSFRA